MKANAVARRSPIPLSRALRSRRAISVPSRLPVPWRLINPLTRFFLEHGSTRKDFVDGRILATEVQTSVRITALGDLALTRAPAQGYGSLMSALVPLFARSDIVTANLEAMFTERESRAGINGSFLRAPPEAIEALPPHDGLVLSLANNHAMDFGSQAMADSLDHLAQRRFASCGHSNPSGAPQHASLLRRGQRIALLGFCDDHQPAPTEFGIRPLHADPVLIETAVRNAREQADIVLVHFHWGYEFRLHPLLSHRDLARKTVEWGASAVLCHHAHVPMGIELWKHGIIAHGLGNCVMPRRGYQVQGHPWTGRSFALELGFDGPRLAEARIHPIDIDEAGMVSGSSPEAAHRFLKALGTMSARLDDTEFLARLERHRLRSQAILLGSALADAARKSDEHLQERLETLALPRQQALMTFLRADPVLRPLRDVFDLLFAHCSNFDTHHFRPRTDRNEIPRALSAVTAVLTARLSNADALAERIP